MTEQTNKLTRKTTGGLFNKKVETTFKRSDLSKKEVARLSRFLKSINVAEKL